MNFSYTSEQISQKRAHIRAQVLSLSPNIKSGKITLVNTADLVLLFGLYDHIFLKDYFKTSPVLANISFSWSERLTKAAGKTIFYRQTTALGIDKSYQIRIATDFFWEYEKVARDIKVCGIKTQDALEALQLVFEHELCHLIEYVQTDTSSCHQKAFHTLAGNLFGHTEFTHQLPTNQEIARVHYGFLVGEKVSFDFEGKILTGLLHKVQKRAIVMVAQANGTFLDAKGVKYAKYYVPLEILKKAM